MRKNLKELAKIFERALMGNENEIVNVVYGIINGNYAERDYEITTEYLDPSKKQLGKKGFNLVAFIGNRSLHQYFEDEHGECLNWNQTIAIYKYLSDVAKDKFNNLVRVILLEFYEDLK